MALDRAGALVLGRGRLGPVVAVCGAGILMSAAMARLFDPGDPSRAYYALTAAFINR